MLIIHKLEHTHFSSSEAIIIDYILEQGLKIKNMSANSIAKATLDVYKRQQHIYLNSDQFDKTFAFQ